MVTKAFELYISATGLSLAQAQAAGYNAAASVITKGDRASYYPGSQSNTICLILDKATAACWAHRPLAASRWRGASMCLPLPSPGGMTVAEITSWISCTRRRSPRCMTPS